MPWPEFSTAAIWLASAALLLGMPVSHDVIWQLWVARQMNAGVGLYTWIVEVNPPLWFWMAGPVDLLATKLDVPARMLVVAANFALVGLSLLVTARLIAHWPARRRAAVLGASLLVLIFGCLGNFGQREHQCLMAAIPYALLIARRAEGHTVHWALALGVALLAAPMFALKHYFLLVPVLLESWLIAQQRRNWRPLRPETLALAALAATYALAVLVFTPTYLTEIVPMLRLAYSERRMMLLPVLLNRMTLALVLACFYFWHVRRTLETAGQAMLLVTLAFLLSYAAQAKGWAYHIDPVVGALTIAVAIHIAMTATTVPMKDVKAWIVATLIPLIGLGPVILEGPYRNPYERAVQEMLAPVQPGGAALMLTARPSHIWPMVDDAGLAWPVRQFGFWMTQAAANLEREGQAPSPELATLFETVREQTLRDMLCNPPEIVIDDKDAGDGTSFSILEWLREDSDFAAIFTAYEPYGELGMFTRYRLVAAVPAQDADADCQPLTARR